MKTITFIKADIVSTSPLFIGDDDKNILVDNENQRAYLPATSIAGSFRSYLQSIGKEEEGNLLFGNKDNSQISKVYVADAFAQIHNYDLRDGLRIDGETGTNVHGSKIERIYISSGLKFTLNFEIHSASQEDLQLKPLIYKALKGLDAGLLRFGGHKSSGLGLFRLEDALEWEYRLDDLDDLSKYLKREEKDKKSILSQIDKEESGHGYVQFKMKGSLTTPLIIGAPRSFNPDDADDLSMKTGNNEYLIPGSSFKGLLRARMETIANYFEDSQAVKEIFGELKEKNQNKKPNILSRILVRETIIDNSKYLEDVMYNRIKIDKFTSGVRYGSLMQDIPVRGDTDFDIIYRKSTNEEVNNYAIGLIILALRDLGLENMGIGGNESIGRGRFRASSLTIDDGKEFIVIDFDNKTISNDEVVSKYVGAVESFVYGGDK